MKNIIRLLIATVILWGCSNNNKETVIKQKIEKYFLAWNNQAFNYNAFSSFKRDTSYTWYNKKEGKGNKSIFNPNSGWKQWDKAWKGTYSYNIIKIYTDSMKVTGRFRETNDFLKIIGMPEGYSSTVTYWFDDDFKVKETLYEWDIDNRKMSEVIQPVIKWAMVNDSARIEDIYIKNGFKPNKENAKAWKILLDNYHNYITSSKNGYK